MPEDDRSVTSLQNVALRRTKKMRMLGLQKPVSLNTSFQLNKENKCLFRDIFKKSSFLTLILNGRCLFSSVWDTLSDVLEYGM